MRDGVLYLESVAGIAGDMFTAAFLDAGLVSLEEIQSVPERLGFPEVRVVVTETERAGAMDREKLELSTPTGLAILRALDPEFRVGWPGGRLVAQGSGAGSMRLNDYPNVFWVARPWR